MILSLDGGGIKGYYSLIIMSGIEKECDVEFQNDVTQFVGTSIGGVISSLLAYGLSVDEITRHFISFQNEIHKGHNHLINKLFTFMDYIFGKSLFEKISDKVFLPVYNYTDNKLEYFGRDNSHQNILITDIIKSICSDIRIIQPFYNKELNKYYADAGIFAYDPILFYLRNRDTIDNERILSIGSGVIQNISNDLNIENKFDLIYDTFLYDQFETTQYLFKKNHFSYFRISEFPYKKKATSIAEVLKLATYRTKLVNYERLKEFLNKNQTHL